MTCVPRESIPHLLGREAGARVCVCVWGGATGGRGSPAAPSVGVVERIKVPN